MNNKITLHKAEKSGRLIALNMDPDSIAILRLPTIEEMDHILELHELAVLENLWSNTLLAERSEHHCLEAFVPRAASSSGLRYFTHEAVNVHLNTEMIRGLGERVRALSLDEQRKLLDKLWPRSRKEFEEIATLAAKTDLLGVDLRAELASTKDVKTFILSLQQRASAGRSSDNDRSGPAEQAIEVLTMLRAQGYLLLPASFRSWKSTAKWRVALNPIFAGAPASLMLEVGSFLHKPNRQLNIATLGQVCVLISQLQSIDDLSPSLLEALEVTLTKVAIRPGHARDATAAFREMWNERYPTQAFKRIRTEKRKAESEKRTSGQFGWLVQQQPLMTPWQEPLSRFVADREANSKQGVIADLNLFCDFLLTHPAPPLSPEETQRALHIRDVTFQNQNTLMRHLEQADLNSKRKTRVLSYVREFFDWYHDWLLASDKQTVAANFRNPVSAQDGFQSSGSSAGQTFRTALPSWLLRELRRTLTDNDFAFPKQVQKHDMCTLRDRETGDIVSLWWPGTAIILTILLELPLRSHQARWLDSGEFDDVIYDLQAGKEIQNPNLRAVLGRREGCLRLLEDSLRQESWVGAYINTNKTALYREERRGYNIPFIPPELVTLLDSMRRWNKRYLPDLTSLVTYYEEGKGRQEFAAVDQSKLPQIAPLFRDPRSPDKNRPPSSDKVARLWLRVLRETQDRIKRERGVDIQLTEHNAAGKLVWKYDLHTLRVSGISSMIENGVPLEVVSEFVAGHKTLVMTLWYYKNSPGQLREVIAKAHETAQSESDFVGGSEFQENIERFSPFLLSKNALQRLEDGDEAYAALKQHTGLWSVSSDGICPGTSCASGGEYDEANGRYGPVPGGRRCGLCRFWITGPAFLLGQMAEANNLIYGIRKKALQLKEARNEIIDHEDAGKTGLARQARSRVEALERELGIDLAEWQSRHAYAMQSSALLDEYIKARRDLTSDTAVPAPLLTANNESELRLTLEQTDEFVLLEHVTQMSNVLPGFKNNEARLEKHMILSKVLSDNGLPPLLLNLDQKSAEEAANLLSSMLLQYVAAQDRERVLSGETKLRDIPALEAPLHSLITQLAAPAEQKPGPRRIIPLMVESSK